MASTMTKFGHLQIPLEDVEKATNNFHHDNIISHGGFGPAYKGRLLRSGKLIKIAARRLDRKGGLGDTEFWTEVSVLSELKHTNLVSLIGFCDEKGQKIIITTFEANGSLGQFLKDSDLTWTQRLKICVGVARALTYLHYDEGRDYAIIHRNINSETILLDENWEPKLSGFEISMKQSVNRMGQVLLCEPIGTMGYMDPTIEKTGGVTYKSDIYSFGVVLFEILCGRKAFVEKEANRFLAPLVEYHYKRGTLDDILHPDLWNHMSHQAVSKYSNTALLCLKKEREHRPDTRNIVDELQKALEFQLRRENLLTNLEHLKIPLSNIKLVTEDFSETYTIGVKDSYTLYIAQVDDSDKENPSFVIIKRMVLGDTVSKEEEFYTSIEMLTSVNHNNIVTLLGFCVEGFELILVTENVSNGSLARYLGNIDDVRSILTWEKRLKICIDIAHTLHYIHYEMEDQKMIINCDINSYNIGLDENWGAKIVEFGHSVFISPNQEDIPFNHDLTSRSNYYTDPEICLNIGNIKRESDVYSFGVVLFEILCGRTADDPIYLQESDKGLAYVARQSFYEGTLEAMIDPLIKEDAGENNCVLNRGPNKGSLDAFIEIAYKCVAESQHQRPTIKVVIKELEKALSFLEDRVPRPAIDQVVNELQLTHENIPEERPLTEQAAYELEKAVETELKHKMLGEKLQHLKIPLSDLKLATNNFSESYKITSWDHITLYRAELDRFDKENSSSIEGKNTVVIKRYASGHDVYGEEEFLTEIEILTSVKHPNIITLLGFCDEGSEMILVTEDYFNGYLAHYLRTDKSNLTWEKRLKICIDVAHALNYLHYEMEDQKVIIMCDLNCRNIVLDENLRAKIVDFWFSVFLPPNQEDEALYLNIVVGSDFYKDPEFENTLKVKRESDVYSFGVVLFEILCGRFAFDPIYLKESNIGLAHVARRSFYTGTLEEMIDPIIKEETSENSIILNRGPNKDSLHTFIEIAYKCVTETQDQRPSMKTVVMELEKALFFQKNNKDDPKISLEDINQATQNFSNENCIGRGGFGRVFKGTLQDGNGFKTIVAKRLDKRLGQGEQQFLSELQILLEYKHENIVGLVGYCNEQDEKIIVYEYAPRGSLDLYLNDASLTWVKRLNICIDVASALDFIHGGFQKQAKVIHRDIKTANILLNNDWKAKLADFGLSLISPLVQQTDYVIDYACGTPGYLDPLYRKSGFLTIESDIYSFGVVLFEMMCGRSTFAIRKHKGKYLPDFIKNIFEEGKHNEVVFEKIREQIMPKSLTTFQEIAYQCLHHEREKRPTTKKVLMQLKKALEFQNVASTMTKFAHLQIPLEDIVKATNNFHDDNIIRHGEFDTAYKGRLMWSGTLMKIVARRFDYKHGEADLKFLTEISMLSDLKHTNIVSLIGFCDEKDEKIIVTMYEASGSLGQYLNSPSLTWTQRLRICVGVARALSYLYYDEGRDYSIIHCNVNSETILLDENWEAKLSNFEFSIKQLVNDKDQVCPFEHIDRMGCMDPEIEKTGGVTYESDIYSCGVVLFEILCGRKAFIQNAANSDMFLAPLAKYHYENKTLLSIIFHGLNWNQMSLQSLVKYSNTAYSCLDEDPSHRPYMKYVVRELEKALELQLRRENIEKKLGHLKISLTDIEFATNNFSETYAISPHRSCTLYRAELNHFDKENHSSIEGKNISQHPKRHNTVLIKRYPVGHDMYGEEEFYTEIETLSSVEHHNILSLLGFCVERSEMIIVTENASNGFLGEYLGNINDKLHILTWEKRLKICIDVAHSLNYLHSEMKDQKTIINRDINSLNIALDENLGAKIVQFCFSVVLPPNQEDEALNIYWCGKPSYIDPEYKMTNKLKRESDVFSFGVVLFEILCGRLANDEIYHKESSRGLAFVARRNFSSGTLEDIIDPILKEETSENNFVMNKRPNKDSLNAFINIAHQCVAETQDQRPTMKVVIKELERALFFQVSQ